MTVDASSNLPNRNLNFTWELAIIRARLANDSCFAKILTRSNTVDQDMTFKDWLNESPNNEPDKEWMLAYIEKMHDNVDKAFVCDDVLDWKRYLGWVSSPFGEIQIEIRPMILSLRLLLESLNALKTDRQKYLKLFGPRFGRDYDAAYDRIFQLRVGAGKTALDQYARFLRGTDSSLARQADYFRNYYENKIIKAKKNRVSPLILSCYVAGTDHLVCNPLSIRSALGTNEMWRTHGIVDVKWVSPFLEVTFGLSAGQKTKYRALTITN